MASVKPLFSVSAARIDVGGGAELDGLSLSTTGRWVMVLASARALFETAAGLRRPRRGSVRVNGFEPIEAIREGAAAAAPLDPRLPATWTAKAYVTWSARLAGNPRRVAAARAAEAIDRLKLDAFASSPVQSLPRGARRAMVIAAALATGAELVLVEDPTLGLPDATARAFARITARSLADRNVLLFAPRIPLDSPLALTSDEALVIEGSRVAAQGAPAEIASALGLYSLRIVGDSAPFEQALCAEGAKVVTPAAPSASATLTVDLGPVGNAEIFRLAAMAGVVLLEARPLARALA